MGFYEIKFCYGIYEIKVFLILHIETQNLSQTQLFSYIIIFWNFQSLYISISDMYPTWDITNKVFAGILHLITIK